MQLPVSASKVKSVSGQVITGNYKYSTRYAIERTDIRDTYNHFTEWAASGGTLYPDWYAHWKPCYANRSLLYLK